MQSARVAVMGDTLERNGCLTAVGTTMSGSEINGVSKLKNPGVQSAGPGVPAVDDGGGGGESKAGRLGSGPPVFHGQTAGDKDLRPECSTTEGAVPNKTTPGAFLDPRSSAGRPSSLLRRRRLRRNLSAAAASSGGKMSSGVSTASLHTRSLDRKTALRHKQFVQLQPSDREWVRSDLQRGCIYVHDKHQLSCPRPVLCTLETSAAEIAYRLRHLGGRTGIVVRMPGKGNSFDFNEHGDGPPRSSQRSNTGSNQLNFVQHRDNQSGPSVDRLNLLLLADDDAQGQQHVVTGTLNAGVSSHATADAANGESREVRHSVTDSYGLHSGSDAENSTFEDLSSGARLDEHRDSLSDDMILGTDASILSPAFGSAAEEPNTLCSSSDELEIDCLSPKQGTTHLFEQSPENFQHCPLVTAIHGDPRGDKIANNVSSNEGDDAEPGIKRQSKVPYSSIANSLSESRLTEETATKQDELQCDAQTEPTAEDGSPAPSLYVQLHGEAVRRLGQNEQPLNIQNDFLFKLGFKDQWRVQDEGMNSEIGSLIRFYAGKPHAIENSDRIQLSGTYNVRKGKMQLPVNRWTRRQVILCGTCLIVSSVKDSQAGKMHVLPLIGGKVEEVRKQSHCLAFSSSGPQSQTYYVSFDSFTEHLRWQRYTSKIVSQRISSVDLSCCSLERLPPNLFYSQDLTHLNLKHNFLSAGRGLVELQRFSKLRSLNLSNNHLGQFPSAICAIPSLTELNLSCNRLSSVPSAVGGMHNLQTFLLDGNCLSTLPPELGDLPRLTYLGLSFNKFSEVPVVLERLTGVERLCLSGNRMDSLGLQAFRLLHVKHVDLRLNRICKVLPDEPDFLRHVTHLDLRDNGLSELDASLFPRLEVLHCERNRLGCLKVRGTQLKGLHASANDLSQLEISPVPCNLTYMDVSRNCLEELPAWLCDSGKLEALDVSHNRLSQLPERLLCNSSLRKLLAGHNQLQRLPEDLESSHIEVLHVQHNQLAELPPNLFLKADSLRCLNASANRLESLPPSSLSEDSRSALQELYLTNNRLTDKCVPLLTGHCHLRVLHLAYNQLHSFPASKMAKLEELEEVDLSGNRLKAIPTTILSCKRMHTFVAHSNCVEVFPEVMQLAEMKCVDLSCNELSEITLPENLPPKLQELDLTGNPRLVLDHKTLEQLNNIRCFRIDQSPSAFSAGEAPGAPAVWSHGYTEASGVKNKLCVAALSVNSFGENREALYGVFDGDRNVEVPYLLQCTMGDVLAEELHRSKSQEDYMSNTFLVMQRKLGTAGQKLGGSAALCHIRHDPMDPGGCFTLTAANVGKCQAVLCRDGKPLPLSAVHNVSVAEEYERLQQHKAIVTEDNKVNGVTDSTRIMGYSFLYPSVIPRPHVRTVTLTPRDEFVVLGSRGLWESVSAAEAVEAVRSVPGALAAAKKLCTLAQAYGCGDSLSAVVVQLSVAEDCCCGGCCELGAPPPPASPGLFPPAPAVAAAVRDALPTPSSCSEVSSEVSASEMSSEVGSTASDEPPQSAALQDGHTGAPFGPEPRGAGCGLHPVCLVGSFQRQLSSATFSSALSDNGLDSEDEEPIAGVFSNGSRVEVEADVHCLRRREPKAPQPQPPPAATESPDEGETEGGLAEAQRRVGPGGGADTRRGRTLSRKRANGSVAPQERSHNLIEVATDAPTRKPGGYFAAPAQPDPDDQFIIPPELEEEVKEIMKQHQQEQQQQRPLPSEQLADAHDTPL